LVANGGIAIAMVYGRSMECAIGMLMLVLGLPFYWVLSARREHASPVDKRPVDGQL
jgi:hypothetical protein